jgi:hypothetical protein
MRPWVKRTLCVLVTLLLLDQLVEHVVLRDDQLLGRAIAPFDPPLFTDGQRATVERLRAEQAGEPPRRRGARFDPDLGWCAAPGTEGALFAYDWAGCRIGASGPLPRERTPGVRRVATVGCSFTRGDRVPAEAAWPSRVDAARADLEVANLGMGGFGVGQALLRTRRDALPLEPDEVWLGYLPVASLRPLTHYPPAGEHWTAIVAFKPRFVLAPGYGIQLVPSPARTPADVLRLLDDQPAFFEALRAADTWVRRVPAAYAPRGSSWWQRSATARLLVTWRESGGRLPGAWMRDDESEARRLLVELVLVLRGDVRASGARFRMLVLPSRADLRALERDGRGYWEDFTGELAAAGAEVLDLAPALAAGAVQHDGAMWTDDGHYSAAANARVAEAILAAWPD